LLVRLGASEALEAVEGLDEAAAVAALKNAAKEALEIKIKVDSSILQLADTDFFLGRICNSEGEVKFASGSARSASCFMCRKYESRISPSYHVCLLCETPICIRDRGRGMTCLYEHLNSADPEIKCNGTKKGIFPKSRRDSSFGSPKQAEPAASTPKNRSRTPPNRKSTSGCDYFAEKAKQ